MAADNGLGMAVSTLLIARARITCFADHMSLPLITIRILAEWYNDLLHLCKLIALYGNSYAALVLLEITICNKDHFARGIIGHE